MDSLKLTWRDGAYYVSQPGDQSGEYVRLEEYERLCAELAEAKNNPPDALVEQWLQNELADMDMLIDHLSRTYDHFSNGRISKPNTLPEEVFRVAEDLAQEAIEEATSELRALLIASERRAEDAEAKFKAHDDISVDAWNALHAMEAMEKIVTDAIRATNPAALAAPAPAAKPAPCGECEHEYADRILINDPPVCIKCGKPAGPARDARP